MLKGKTVFVHGGPGGNAIIEKIELEGINNLYFWSEPEKCNSFEQSVTSLQTFILENQIDNIIAHSFGALLVSQIENLQVKKIILLAPTFDIIACDLSILNALEVYNPHLKTLAKIIKSENKIWTPKVLEALQIVTSMPEYSSLYWEDTEVFAKFLSTHLKGVSPINISNYIAIRSTFKFKRNQIDIPTTIYIYSKDIISNEQDQIPKVINIFNNYKTITLPFKHFGHLEHGFKELYKKFSD